MAQIIDGSRGGKILLHQGYIYQRNQTSGDSGDVRPKTVVHHLKLMRLTSLNLQIIQGDPSAPLRRVYDQSVVVTRRRENTPTAEKIPLFHQVASQLKRTKYKNVPPVPNNVEDVEINDIWRLTWEGDDYIVHQDKDWGILIYAT